jgi:hypothetical protein
MPPAVPEHFFTPLDWRNFNQIFSLFFDEEKEFWTSYGLSSTSLALNGERLRPTGLCRLNVEPVSTSGLIEWKAGLPLDKILNDEEFRVVNRYIGEILHRSKTSRLHRCGCRLQAVSSEGLVTTEDHFLGSPLRSSVLKALDSISARIHRMT